VAVNPEKWSSTVVRRLVWSIGGKTEVLGSTPVPATLCLNKQHMDWYQGIRGERQGNNSLSRKTTKKFVTFLSLVFFSLLSEKTHSPSESYFVFLPICTVVYPAFLVILLVTEYRGNVDDR